ncbi:MAG TPA: phage holin family protein [Steroidobacteraceae bacterium]|nr:phage holin family protein [Steroidobacteraceae bacterium]
MNNPEERPLSTVVTDIFGNLQDMVRSELRLASAEMKQEVTRAARSGGLIAGGGGLGLYALGFLLLTIMFLLAKVVDLWLAALIVCLLVSAVAAMLVLMGQQRMKRAKLVPRKTVQSVKENVSWMKAQIK